MQKLRISCLLNASLLMGCSIHKLEIQQGNVVTPEMMETLKIGMTTRQVRFILGSPQLVDPFRENRWDYIYRLRQEGEVIENSRLTVYFEGDTLSRIEKDSGHKQATP